MWHVVSPVPTAASIFPRPSAPRRAWRSPNGAREHGAGKDGRVENGRVMAINCVVIDAGARYGLHPTWADLRGLAEFHLFEMDADEARRLQRKYESDPRIKVYPLALYSSDTTLTFRVSQHQALNSVFQSNDNLLRQNEYMVRDFAVTEDRKTEARSLDSLFAGREIHFL